MQDTDSWETITFRAKKPKNTPQGIEKARQQGLAVETSRKFNAGGNKQGPGVPTNAGRIAEDRNSIDEDADKIEVKHVSRDVSRVIQQARSELGITQRDLAVRVNVPASTVADYEAGRGVPNQQVLGKMERVLGYKLRGKDIGSKMEPKHPKGKQAAATGASAGAGAGRGASRKH
eukprot:TRINITY_DN234_c0_g1_i1.p1 TRINITY_DN234_c0_g1~~TRINITY_DN234_c0_g1_i1.p1  ORF type:complete len:175 (-),score=29.43 TRINITY_DN234_c0_g1_i1:120-644(-)